MDVAATEPKPQLHSGPSPLAALTSSALALHGLNAGEARADSPVDRVSADYRYSYYREDPLAAENFAAAQGGSQNRYQIHAHQFNVVAPVTSRIDTGIDLVYETMAGATPWYVVPGPEPDRPLQAMTGATIEEQRVDVNARVTHYFDRSTLNVSGGISDENDYFAGSFGFGGTRSYFDKNLTLALGFGFSWDTIEPTDPTSHGHLLGARYSKETTAMDFSASQLLAWKAMMQLGLSWKAGEGFLSDPYKLVRAGTRNISDSRPSTRDQLALTLRYRQLIEPADGTLHMDVGYHWDSWGTNALSVEVSWYQRLAERWLVTPHLRYYSQSQAEFYGPIFQSENPEFATSDYRLSPFGAISFGLKGAAELEEWPVDSIDTILSLGYERYMSSGSLSLRTVDVPSPGLMDYHMVSARVGARF